MGHRKCSRQGCQQLQASVGELCAEHRAANPPRKYSRWHGGPTKRCARCELDKPLAEYRLQHGRPRSYCIECGNAVNQQWRTRHHDELLARRRAAYGEVRNAVYARRRREWAAAHDHKEGGYS